MKSSFLLTAFGRDRPGMVAGITGALVALKGNIADASMTRLGGEFTMMLICDFSGKPTPAAIAKVLRPIEKQLGIQWIVRPLSSAATRPSKAQPPKFLISVYGSDHPGIVHAVAEALAQRRCSITDLNTRVLRRPKKPLYILLLEVAAPSSLDLDDLREELDRLRGSLGVEISLQDIEPVAF